MGREDRIHQEAIALWRAMFTEPPPDRMSGEDLLALITRQLPTASYARLKTPHLRPANISLPSGGA